jgi:hypothetical protein
VKQFYIAITVFLLLLAFLLYQFRGNLGLGNLGADSAAESGGGKKSGAPAPEAQGLRIVGIVDSERPSAVLDVFGKLQTIMVGDEILLPQKRGEEPQRARCEVIAGQMVTLYFQAANSKLELQLAQ